MTSLAPDDPPNGPRFAARGFAGQGQAAPPDLPEGEYVIDLRFLGRALYSAKWVALVACLLGTAYGLWNLRKYDPAYEAVMVVSPSRSGDTTQGSALPTVGVALSLGLAFGEREATNFDRLSQLIGSLQLAELLQRKYSLLQTIFADGYDPESKTWRRPTDSGFERQEYIQSLLRQKLWRPPDMAMLADYLKERVTVKKMDPLPFTKVSYSHADPRMARFILEIVYAEADALLREQDRLENSRRKLYLQEQLSKVAVQDIRTVLLRLVTNTEQSSMLLESDLPYAARIVEPPRAPVQPEPASLLRIVAVPAFAALFVAVVLFVLVALLRRE